MWQATSLRCRLVERKLESLHAGHASESRLGCLRRLLDDPTVLADDSSPRGPLAGACGFPVQGTGSGMAPHVAGRGRFDRPLAKCGALFNRVELGSGGHSLLRGPAAL